MVLILVLVEHALGDILTWHVSTSGGLNPCFSGTCSRSQGNQLVNQRCCVLILVLVEHALGVTDVKLNGYAYFVLILVLVEHALGGIASALLVSVQDVLILVLVEHALGDSRQDQFGDAPRRLNPCFSGTCSRRVDTDTDAGSEDGLNPCFSGTCSRRTNEKALVRICKVLILVLVEHALGDATTPTVFERDHVS